MGNAWLGARCSASLCVMVIVIVMVMVMVMVTVRTIVMVIPRIHVAPGVSVGSGAEQL
jgi:hypothetical protein